MIRPDRSTQSVCQVFPGQIHTELMPTHRFIDLRVGCEHYLLLCEGNETQEEFYGLLERVNDYGLAFLKRGRRDSFPAGHIVRSISAQWRVLSLDQYDEMGRKLNDISMANDIEFLEPLETVSSDLIDLRGSRQETFASGYPFPDPSGAIERMVGPLGENLLLFGMEWERLLECKHDSDDQLTPSIMGAIDIYFSKSLREPGAIVLDPMLGTGGYLREVGERYPCKIVVGDTNEKILSAFNLEGVEKQLSDAAESLDRLGDRKKDVKLVVLRGCNFLVVTHVKAQTIFANIYEKLEKGSGIIVTGATRVLFDSDFINLFPGAKILQRITWNTHGVLLPFYVVIKGD